MPFLGLLICFIWWDVFEVAIMLLAVLPIFSKFCAKFRSNYQFWKNGTPWGHRSQYCKTRKYYSKILLISSVLAFFLNFEKTVAIDLDQVDRFRGINSIFCIITFAQCVIFGRKTIRQTFSFLLYQFCQQKQKCTRKNFCSPFFQSFCTIRQA